MDVYEVLYTTRAHRRVKPDPVPHEVQARILDAAIRAPSGGNSQDWRFLLLDDADRKSRVGELYRHSIAQLWETVYAERIAAAQQSPDSPESKQMLQVQRSAQHLADHFEETPLFLFAFSRFDPSGGSIYPAVWSAMLAGRAEGVGTALTTVLSFFHHDEVLEILGVPLDERWRMACCVSFGYPTGTWGVAERVPVHQVAFRNGWGQPLGFEVPKPLWQPT